MMYREHCRLLYKLRHLLEVNEENYKKFRLPWPVQGTVFQLKTSRILNMVSVHSRTMLGHLFANLHSTILDDGKINKILAILKI
jgi:hypothetical protein